MKYAYFQINDNGLSGDVYLVEASGENVALGKLVSEGVVPAWRARGGILGMGSQRNEVDEDESQHVLVRVVEVR